MVPKGRPPPSPVVSSSSTLWATASKDWVIPAKPKPGRKPKKDIPPAANGDEELHDIDGQGRRVQNRAAQRAFRERKQSQLADLQARIQQYEKGEIERNVALQAIAKRLKDENEELRTETKLLKERIAKLEAERGKAGERKRSRDDSPSDLSGIPEHPTKKRPKAMVEPISLSTQLHSFPPYLSSPSSISSPESSGRSFSPIHLDSPSERSVTFHTHAPTLANILSFPNNGKPCSYEPNGPYPQFDCGFCNEDTPCVCREIALQQTAVDQLAMTEPPLKIETFEQVDPNSSMERSIPFPRAPPPQLSILDNLPAYQPPVPLPRKQGTNANKSSIFPVAPPPPQPSSALSVNCSGDPSNCMACADDSFGKAFCTAISESVAPCSCCSGAQCNPGSACCGNPSSCTSPSAAQPSSPKPPSELIPTDDAWRQLKTHPNIAFTDLSLLAEVVARRSKCTGPEVVISPALGSITPERTISPPVDSYTERTNDLEKTADNLPILLTDPHAHYHEKQRARSGGPSSPPRLVPQEVLIRCGRGVRHVRADAVKEALRLLDSKLSHS